jgi:alpha-tubulin suppressor-like RCC1 family protein
MMACGSWRCLPHLLVAMGVLALAACGGGGGGTGDADAASEPADAGLEVGRAMDTAAETGPDTAVWSCLRNEDCPAGSFCGVGSSSCVSRVVEVTAGANHTCARHEDGRVSCWGSAESIEGGGAAVLRPTWIPRGTGAKTIAAGVHLTCGVFDGGQVRCWGNRNFTVLRAEGTPLAGATRVTAGDGFGCALNAEGAQCWGRNDFGQLARPLDTKESGFALTSQAGAFRFLAAGIAIVVHDGGERLCAWGQNATKMISDADGVNVIPSPTCRTAKDVVELVAGDTHACVRHAAGTFTCWGERYYGQLGIGGDDTADVGPPGQTVALTDAAGAVAKAVALAAGTAHTCALLENGGVTCFGRNSRGQIGAAAPAGIEEIRTPTAVPGFTRPVRGLGGGSTAQHTCAIFDDGSVACWGYNHASQFGDNAPGVDASRSSRMPVAVRF